MARAAARRLHLRALRPGGDRAARGAASRGAGEARRGGSRARAARRLIGELEALVARAPAARAAARPAHARAVPLGPPGRGSRRLPGGQARARGRARDRAGPGAAASSSGRSCARNRRSTLRRSRAADGRFSSRRRQTTALDALLAVAEPLASRPRRAIVLALAVGDCEDARAARARCCSSRRDGAARTRGQPRAPPRSRPATPGP